MWILNRAAQSPRKLLKELAVPSPKLQRPSDLSRLRGSNRLEAPSLIHDLPPTPVRSSPQVYRDKRGKILLSRTWATDDYGGGKIRSL